MKQHCSLEKTILILRTHLFQCDVMLHLQSRCLPLRKNYVLQSYPSWCVKVWPAFFVCYRNCWIPSSVFFLDTLYYTVNCLFMHEKSWRPMKLIEWERKRGKERDGVRHTICILLLLFQLRKKIFSSTKFFILVCQLLNFFQHWLFVLLFWCFSSTENFLHYFSDLQNILEQNFFILFIQL